MVVTAAQVHEAYERSLKYTNPNARLRASLEDYRYSGNLGGTPRSTYYWFINCSYDSRGEWAMDYYLLVTNSGNFVGILSTGWYQKIGLEDTWCTPHIPYEIEIGRAHV